VKRSILVVTGAGASTLLGTDNQPIPKMLPGLTSRCTSPALWAATSAAATCSTIATAWSGASGPSLNARTACLRRRLPLTISHWAAPRRRNTTWCTNDRQPDAESIEAINLRISQNPSQFALDVRGLLIIGQIGIGRGIRQACALRFGSMREWWKRHAAWLAIGFAALALALLLVVGCQAAMLHARGWRIALGTVPEWLAGFGTGFTAIAALAAYRTLKIAAGQWEAEQAQRREQLKKQATLIVVEAVSRAEMVRPANQAPVRPDGKPEYRYVVIRNHSQEPIFNVRIPDGSHLETKEKMPWTTSVAEVRAQQEAGSFSSPRPTIVHRHPPDLVPVLAPGQATFQLHLVTVPRDEQPTEYVFFTFTDARGARWQRLGSEQPVQIIDEQPLSP
jgi:hypothetical protein